MNVNAKQRAWLWNGTSGRVIATISKKANVLFDDGVRRWVPFSDIERTANVVTPKEAKFKAAQETLAVRRKKAQSEGRYKSDEDIAKEFEGMSITGMEKAFNLGEDIVVDVYFSFPDGDESVGGGATSTAERFRLSAPDDLFSGREEPYVLRISTNNWYPDNIILEMKKLLEEAVPKSGIIGDTLLEVRAIKKSATQAAFEKVSGKKTAKNYPMKAGWFVYDKHTEEVVAEGLESSDTASARIEELYKEYEDKTPNYKKSYSSGSEGLGVSGSITKKAEVFLDTEEDMAWLKEVHIPDMPEAHSAILEGNEDAPDKVILYTDQSPLYNDTPAATYVSNEEGNLVKEASVKTAGHPKESEHRYEIGDGLVPSEGYDRTHQIKILDVVDKDYVVEQRPFDVEEKQDPKDPIYGVRYEIPISTLDKDKAWVKLAKKTAASEYFKKMSREDFIAAAKEYLSKTDVVQRVWGGDVDLALEEDQIDMALRNGDATERELQDLLTLQYLVDDVIDLEEVVNPGTDVEETGSLVSHMETARMKEMGDLGQQMLPLESSLNVDGITNTDDHAILDFGSFVAAYDKEGTLVAANYTNKAGVVAEKEFPTAYRKEFGNLIKAAGFDGIKKLANKGVKKVAALKKKAERLGNWDFDKHDPIWKVEADDDGQKKLVRC